METIHTSQQKISKGQLLNGDFQCDTDFFRTIFDRSSDIVFRELILSQGCKAVLIFVDGLVDVSLIDRDIVAPLMQGKSQLDAMLSSDIRINDIEDFLQKNMIYACQTGLEAQLEIITESIAAGDTALILEGSTQALLFSIRDRKSRAIEESPSEPVIRGPREGFTEDLRTNTSLIRSRLKTPKLKMESLKIGELSRTDVILTYVDGIVEEELLNEVRARLQKIKIDAVLESGYIEELIEDNKFTTFPQVLSTERPDRVTAAILEGRVGIMVNNTPFALVVPITLSGLLQSPEDYYQRFMVATTTRWLRFCSAFTALAFPSIYIAVSTFHQEMIPANLLLSIASSREAVPFPAIIEAFLMELAFEGLREAGIRLPRTVGQAVSIVGALVIGQAAVQAGIVSATLVIIVSFTGIASFIFPSYSLGIAARLLRFPLMVLAGTLGLYGVFLGLITICIHLLKLRSFGVPYMAAAAPLSLSGLKDSLIRIPWKQMSKRQQYKKNSKKSKLPTP